MNRFVASGAAKESLCLKDRLERARKPYKPFCTVSARSVKA